MRQKFVTFISGIFAVGIYYLLLNTLFYYFDHYKKQKSIHFVKKNENRIRITLVSPIHHSPKNTKVTEPILKKRQTTPQKIVKKIVKKIVTKPIENPIKKKIIEKKVVPKKVVPKKIIKSKIIKPKIIKKRVIKEKVVKKIVTKKIIKKIVSKVSIPKHKPINTKELFSSVTTKYSPSKTANKLKIRPKPHIRKSIDSLFGGYTPNSSPSNRPADTKGIEERRDKGIENAYFAKIKDILTGWPAQHNFIGQKAIVFIEVEPSGKFLFRVTTASSNQEFNIELIQYLRGLQERGFGRHKGKRAYTLDVEFIARD
ncbi:MAG: hypothetical protein QM493_00440 [Sulfurovum sp.]